MGGATLFNGALVVEAFTAPHRNDGFDIVDDELPPHSLVGRQARFTAVSRDAESRFAGFESEEPGKLGPPVSDPEAELVEEGAQRWRRRRT